MSLNSYLNARLAGSAAMAGALVCATATGLVAAPGAASAWSAPDSFRDLAKQVKPAVVNIAVEAPAQSESHRGAIPDDSPMREFFDRFFGDRFEFRETPGGRPGPHRPAHGVGSGFIVDSDGYVVTNEHVAGSPGAELVVTLHDGRKFDAELVGADPKTDLALLRIETDDSLPYVRFGDSDKIEVGDWIVAVGNPFGLGGSVTTGIVSAHGRDLHTGPFDDFIQTDAAINRGNSGGPSFNMEGEVIGVNTMIFSPNGGNVGIGFAIPSNLVQDVVSDLKDDGAIERGWLGVSIQTVTPEIAESLGLDAARGALVASIDPSGPAAAAGLADGDVIVRFGDESVEKMRDLPRLVASRAPDAEAEIVVWRRGEEKVLTARLGRQQQSARLVTFDDGEPTDGQLGLAVAPVDAAARAKLGLGKDVSGVMIVGVRPDGPAAKAGLRRRDVIESANQQDVAAAGDLRERLDAAVKDGRKSVLLRINRGGDRRFVTVQIAIS